MNDEEDRYLKTKAKLEEVSSSFCLAKWNQVTLHLQNGRTHSCHHPSTHFVPPEELLKNPSAIHNSNYKKEQRKKMLEGERPSECSYCWDIEDLPGDQISDRYIKSEDPNWNSKEDIERISSLPWDHNINPSYIEVSFSNKCNLKCTYCSPVNSTKWTQEIKKHGGYKLFANREHHSLDYLKSSNSMPLELDDDQDNVYVEAFWKWWPTAVNDLKVFRITGGEPLLDKNTFRILDELIKKPIPGLEISINTNGCAPDALIETFITKMKQLNDLNVMGTMTIYTSVDGYGKQAEFGRTGLDYKLWRANIVKMLTRLPKIQISIMCTTNIFSLPSLKDLCADMLILKNEHYNEHRTLPVIIDFNILRYPGFLNISILPTSYKSYLEDVLEFIKLNNYEKHPSLKTGFCNFEMIKIKRMIDFMQEAPEETSDYNKTVSIADFYLFIEQMQQRRSVNFIETFPEYAQFYSSAKFTYINLQKKLNNK